MTIQHHPDIATLLVYASGSLGEALSVVVASHLDVCGKCRREVARMNRIGGAIMDGSQIEPVAAADTKSLIAGRKGAVSESLAVREITGLPRPLARLLGRPLADVPWRAIVPGVKLHTLPLSAAAAGHLALLKVAPGRGIPDHGHGGTELTMVLEGAFRDERGVFRVGDVEDMDAETDHRLMVEGRETCICLVASESKAIFKGLTGRLLGPLTPL